MPHAHRKALLLTAPRFEDLEVFVPKLRLEEIGFDVTVAAPQAGRVVGEHGDPIEAQQAIADVDPGLHDVLVLPGGQPDGGAGLVRKEPRALDAARAFFVANKPVGAICHGPYTLVSAKVLQGRRMTSVPKDGVPDECRAAGATWEDRDVVVDGNLVTSRTPKDLAAFCRELVRLAGAEESWTAAPPRPQPRGVNPARSF